MSTLTNHQRNELPRHVFLLYYSFVDLHKDHIKTSSRHSHENHWQLEIAVSGSLQLYLPSGEYLLTPGMAILIPPAVSHEFRYSSICREFVSIKFQLPEHCNQLPWSIVMESSPASYFREEIIRFCRCAPTPEHKSVLEYLIADFLDLHYRTKENEVPEILHKINELICTTGVPRPSIKSIASRLGYSSTHLSRITKQTCNVTLKTYIDREQFKTACRYLSYSELTISEIADKLGFPEIYSFSRFFSRMNHGEPPSEFRKDPDRPRYYSPISSHQPLDESSASSVPVAQSTPR